MQPPPVQNQLTSYYAVTIESVDGSQVSATHVVDPVYPVLIYDLPSYTVPCPKQPTPILYFYTYKRSLTTGIHLQLILYGYEHIRELDTTA